MFGCVLLYFYFKIPFSHKTAERKKVKELIVDEKILTKLLDEGEAKSFIEMSLYQWKKIHWWHSKMLLMTSHKSI